MGKSKIKLVHTDTLSCEPIVRYMPNGELLLVSQCGDTYEPAPRNRVYVFHSIDNGKTWSEPAPILPENGEAVYMTELNCVDGVVRAYLTYHNGQFFNWRSVVAESRDNGYTWTDTGAFAGLETYTFIRGLLTLRDGRMLLPYQRYPVSSEENERLVRDYHESYRSPGKLSLISTTDVNIDYVDNGVMISDDGGISWTKHSCPHFAMRGNTGLNWIWSEPTIAELSGGRIAMLIRVTNDVLWYSESSDGGKNWTEFTPTDIPNPSCKPKLLNLPDNRIALIHDPSPKRRNPLAVWISDDDMKSWGQRDIISDFPLKFDYPDAFYRDGHIYISIELHRRDILFIDYTV